MESGDHSSTADGSAYYLYATLEINMIIFIFSLENSLVSQGYFVSVSFVYSFVFHF